MKDFVPKGTGNSRFLKSVSNFLSLYPDYNSFAQALVAGTLPIDLNGVNSAGYTQLGTALNKANLLDDTTAAALELTGDPTVNQALYALSQKGSPAEVHVMCDNGKTATMKKGSKTLSAVADSTGYAILYPTELGDWTVTGTSGGSSFSVTFSVNVIGILYCYPFEVGDSLETTTWANISKISKLGMAQEFFSVGDTKTIKVNGVSYTAQIIGFDHDTPSSTSSYGRSKAGITFQLVDCLNTTYQMETSNTNANGWDGCLMRKTTLGTTILGQLETDLKNVLVFVNKLASAGNQSATIKTSSDKLFLLSEVEIFGSTTYSKAGEGTQYEWYKAGNSKIKKVNGSASNWWERSPRGDDATLFCCVYSGGGSDSNAASSSRGVSFGFCV